MNPQFSEIWVYLSASPLLGLSMTLLAYQGAFWLYQRSGQNPLANPVLIAVSLLVLFLTLTATRYETYFAGAQFVHFLLGPATVALAIPLYTQFKRIRTMLLPVIAGLLAGSLTAVLSAVLIGRWFGASLPTQLSLAPKSVTTPIAMAIAERIGGIPSLTAVLVIITGVLGAVGARTIFDAMKVRDPAIRGFAIGVASHGIGTARAFQVNEQSGAFAALAMGLNGGLTALLVPLMASWIGRG
ncbi:MAG TPA: LrgB family protein [Accumulibacter sp.]|uniref:Inner membrane protein YohK n=2 Tax=Candidatus Accumulibacter TaxID=327159 RepID=A0A080M2N4_9PROT|nr:MULTISPECIES: LrgB family protein [Candidatus Accumulibacter]KFB75508.1 MAG: Inner membrane protein YohK [Candidatus Accumulibacter cognatus]MBL8402099.1 LrgB family protein [Accumulibacter sp.]MBN8517782.1 LrgB family protein [Accumulibacter sp.]MBO3711042.1 LrgB family protein [Accumulibacter sp.]MCM8578503.1 LrgB family protein [Accumulibacter sp.]